MNKQDYSVADGVEFVNAARVPDSRIVSLTPAEAMFDLAVGRISLVASKRKAKSAEKPDGEAE